MIHDEELQGARNAVMNLFNRWREPIKPQVVIAALTKAGFCEGLIRSANISLVASGELTINRNFELEKV